MPSKVAARDIMSTNVVTLRESTPVVRAAELLVSKSISSAPVVREDFTRQMLAGFVSEKDLMQCYASGRFHTEPDLRVAAIMRPHPVCVRPETDLYTLAAIFMQHGYRHVPVVAAQVLLGIVSRRDVLSALIVDHANWSEQDPKVRKAPDLSEIFTPRFLLG